MESDQSARLRMADIATSTNAWIGWKLSIALRVCRSGRGNHQAKGH